MTKSNASNRVSDLCCNLDNLFFQEVALDEHQKLTVLDSNAPSQADVVTFKAFTAGPDAAKFPHVARWYKHIASYESEFSTLPGDSSKAFTAYGPESTELPVNPKDKPEEDEEEEDLFGSDSEEEDAAVVAEREKRLADYKAKKAAKGPKPAAKSLVTLEVKPWGMCPFQKMNDFILLTHPHR